MVPLHWCRRNTRRQVSHALDDPRGKPNPQQKHFKRNLLLPSCAQICVLYVFSTSSSMHLMMLSTLSFSMYQIKVPRQQAGSRKLISDACVRLQRHEKFAYCDAPVPVNTFDHNSTFPSTVRLSPSTMNSVVRVYPCTFAPSHSSHRSTFRLHCCLHRCTVSTCCANGN